MIYFETAKSAGFCFGVNRAVEMVNSLLNSGKKVATLGPIIHNAQVVSSLEKRGVVIVNHPDDAPDDAVLVIRSHGIEKTMFQKITGSGQVCADATCPFVKKIHKITEEAAKSGKTGLIAGDASHPEVIGIKSYCAKNCLVFGDKNELERLLQINDNFANKNIVVVAQTTFDAKKWNICVNLIKKLCTNAEIFDTICDATFKRQNEAEEMAQRCDYMVIVGGRHSSNTAKLYELCSKYCDVCLVETADEIDRDKISAVSRIGLTAGASTPAGIIKEVQNLMSEILETNSVEEVSSEKNEPVATADEAVNAETVAAEPPAQEAEQTAEKSFDEMTDEEALEYSLSNMNSDQKVKGIVLGITPTEIQVDIGRKHAGYVPINEYSFDSAADPAKEVNIGDELDLIVMKTNDQEGTVMLSKKRFDAIKNRERIYNAANTNETLTGRVIEIVKGGLLLICDGIQFFVPASQATLSKDEPIEDLLHKTVDFKILELNKGKRRAVASIKATLRDVRREQRAEFWQNVEEGKVYTGKVKSITSYGAFVDLGGVDGMAHISELSWKRIKNPTEVVNINDIIQVYVKSFDIEKHKVSLGYKKSEDNPWNIFMRDYHVGDVIDVKIVSMTAYGAFANIIDGVDGLIHISQISNTRIAKPQDVLKVGDDVKAKITAVDSERKRVSLSISALLETEEPAAESETPVEAEEVSEEQQ